ncbi:MAG: multiheme c-type cytochrome [Ignavibacteriaceae bacterium]|nr:multiheme c-type cytochrome [Ignavibacteriaceae bacterium]
MFSRILITLISLPIFLISAQTEHGFIGSSSCGMCHKTEKQGSQLSIWQNSKHAQAYKTLQTEKADQIAAEKGFKTKAVETPECLKCHASGYNVDAKLIGEKFKVEEGVQCETCHGAGADYKSKKVMENRAESIANGMIAHDNLEDFCIGCHNAESPTYVDFNLEEMWDKIKHPVPEK